MCFFLLLCNLLISFLFYESMSGYHLKVKIKIESIFKGQMLCICSDNASNQRTNNSLINEHHFPGAF